MIRGAGNTIYAVGPALDTSLFQKKHPFERTIAYIMAPRNKFTPNDEESLHYPVEHDQLMQLLRNLIPHVEIEEYKYYPIRMKGKEPVSAGRALFEYNNVDGAYHRDWRLWMEERAIKALDLGIAIDVESW
ncbi:uncharacterized protein GIQ15_04849 [Arthroderma uncinatum]|uniref:uncharacterized protein n=1 Tax=Arthroderma uncinatum TaxID=74035 RepID=UPI00144ACACE|nr:uncharacterized protein GIQ15_04849 [Arthroderma uncinatum]KAF3482090.1 hypothetical protein GIQ15_04849 [Arthroderma uncinatum]